jgi:hypothetical protein
MPFQFRKEIEISYGEKERDLPFTQEEEMRKIVVLWILMGLCNNHCTSGKSLICPPTSTIICLFY